ncbi:YlzJ-like family protein [Paenibacillus thermotolerans]|uniref:YlzJ-like family protein n=1 Tax=Paenibacillus thermotolerans TaxID=3027807 RepID=UPI002368A1C0|nr:MULTISPECIES: YlzJ-like family protein [unclassified Paenibacillus]
MILYTPMPLEQIFQGIEDIAAPQEITLNGVTMQVEVLSASQARIVRLISPNPDDYMNESYAPGSIIQFTPSV